MGHPTPYATVAGSTAGTSSHPAHDRVVVIGAGIAGLAAAARLAHAGATVEVLERHAHPGGKLRTIPTAAGPADAGPTVLTMRPVFEALFNSLDEHLEDHLTLCRQDILARHFWPDGSRLDLFADESRSAEAVMQFAGSRAATQFRGFCARARKLFEAFDAPMMQAAAPSVATLAGSVLRAPGVLRAMAPLSTLALSLARQFDDARLAQLFGRYATYVGGSPWQSPALLALIWQAEASGVWVIEGGMHRLAEALSRIAQSSGASVQMNAHVARIEAPDGRIRAVLLSDGTRISTDSVLFNGDPRALATGALGADVSHVAPQTLRAQRSLSAQVWTFAAAPHGIDLAHHNVFFAADPKAEFDDLRASRVPRDPTLYVCAQDRGLPSPHAPLERFEIILNAPPVAGLSHPAEEVAPCLTRTFQTLRSFGLTFDTLPEANNLTTPARFERLFPATCGALYGQSPHGMTAALRRPRTRTAVRGLYLAGGGVHPGPGVPMATLSGRHAAEAILSDRISTSPSPRTDTPGGISTRSATTGPAR